MGKLFVPPTANTPTDRVREALDQIERRLSNLRGAGTQVVELLKQLDQVAHGLAELEAAGVDVRAERVRFETVQGQLRSHQDRFLAEAGAALQEERAVVWPDRAHWWWFLDEAAARQRRRRLRRGLVGALMAALLLFVAWLAYDRLIAPPRQVRQAFQHSARGEAQVEAGDLRAALAQFEAAAALNPEDPEAWIWQGVIHFELNELDDAQTAFDTARGLSETTFDFLLDRGMIYLRVGDVAAASADIAQATEENPQSGWGYYLQALVAAEQGNYDAALADLERAADLAQSAGDSKLGAYARAQRAMVIQLQLYQPSTPQP